MSQSESNLDSLLTGENALFIDQKYISWSKDPNSVSEEWRALFESWEKDQSTSNYEPQPNQPPSIFQSVSVQSSGGISSSEVQQVAHRQAKLAQLVNAYRVRGHIEASIDPLDRREILEHPELTLDYYDLHEKDLDVEVSGHGVFGVADITTPRKIIDRLRKAYCSGFGVEFMNINDPEKKKWLQRRIETLQDEFKPTTDDRLYALRYLSDSENFEQFLHRRYPGTKRFSLEGAESLVPLLALILDKSAEMGAQRCMVGMAHRGRLNVLANIFNKPIRYILDEFDDEAHNSFEISGDVKYHLGYSNYFETRQGEKIRVTMAFNPSHLEAVNPVIEGRVRARQDRMIYERTGGKKHPFRHEEPNKEARTEAEKSIIPLLIHGDAAFAGQGVVAETLQASAIDGYRTGGTIHVVVNNQIGFTTSPIDARSTPYCTDIARMLAVPIFHVNGEDVEAVMAVAQIAAEWRQTFQQDVVIDMYCFRKWGHNEGDEPSFTQPLLYDVIRKHPTAKMVYAERMMKNNKDLTLEKVNEVFADSQHRLELHLQNETIDYSSTYTSVGTTPQRNRWADYTKGTIFDTVDTSYNKEQLLELLTTANTIPKDISAHRKVQRLMSQRLDMLQGKRPVDWALGEQAAYATLVREGYRVRISGQDVGRGTFSHRHAVILDVENGREYIPLNTLHDDQAPFEVHNSYLSEYAVLGFEHGYSLDWPDGLIIWEAQFGDFANGAQIMIDNFIMATEQKWNRNSGLVMLLPHGYAGQGPEHSSARLERFLQLCAEDNVIVANCTTPANFFHLMRRQVLQKVRKPLVVMSPKSMLRNPRCVSTIDDLSNGSFSPVFDDTAVVEQSLVERLIFCSGKIYYDLEQRREELLEGSSEEQSIAKKVALIRVERLYPFPSDIISEILQKYPNRKEVVWCQEEPRNMGAWPMMDEWFSGVLDGMPPQYIGRNPAASPATGSPKSHKAEQAAIVKNVFSF